MSALSEDREDLAGDGFVLRHIRRHDDEIRAGGKGFVERHRGANAERARFVRSGQYHRTAAAPRNRERFAAQTRIVTNGNACVEPSMSKCAITRTPSLCFLAISAGGHAAPRARSIFRAIVIRELAGVAPAGAQARPRPICDGFVDDAEHRCDRAIGSRAARFQDRARNGVQRYRKLRDSSERTQRLPRRSRAPLAIVPEKRSRSVSRNRRRASSRAFETGAVRGGHHVEAESSVPSASGPAGKSKVFTKSRTRSRRPGASSVGWGAIALTLAPSKPFDKLPGAGSHTWDLPKGANPHRWNDQRMVTHFFWPC